MRSKYISEALLYSNVFGRHKRVLQVVENDDYYAHLWHFNKNFLRFSLYKLEYIWSCRFILSQIVLFQLRALKQPEVMVV